MEREHAGNRTSDGHLGAFLSQTSSWEYFHWVLAFRIGTFLDHSQSASQPGVIPVPIGTFLRHGVLPTLFSISFLPPSPPERHRRGRRFLTECIHFFFQLSLPSVLLVRYYAFCNTRSHVRPPQHHRQLFVVVAAIAATTSTALRPRLTTAQNRPPWISSQSGN